MPTITLDPRSKEVWKANLDILRSFQPTLCARLEAYAAERRDLFEHTESKAENGSWIQDLARTPFFQSDAFPPLPWKTSEEAGGTVLFIYAHQPMQTNPFAPNSRMQCDTICTKNLFLMSYSASK